MCVCVCVCVCVSQDIEGLQDNHWENLACVHRSPGDI